MSNQTAGHSIMRRGQSTTTDQSGKRQLHWRARAKYGYAGTYKIIARATQAGTPVANVWVAFIYQEQAEHLDIVAVVRTDSNGYATAYYLKNARYAVLGIDPNHVNRGIVFTDVTAVAM